MPERIQLRRTAGWRKPAGAVVVARPSRWGNPWRVDPSGHVTGRTVPTRAAAVAAFQQMLERGEHVEGYPSIDEIRTQLAGRDLACWCPLTEPCHADVLLQVANR